jgi:hypothetical protein
LLRHQNGGAVAVWSSSGLTDPGAQFQLDQNFTNTMVGNPSLPLGDAIAMAKSTLTDSEVRKTFILFGDPLLKLKWPGK